MFILYMSGRRGFDFLQTLPFSSHALRDRALHLTYAAANRCWISLAINTSELECQW